MASRSPADPRHGLPLWALACFLISGAAGLLYEVAWSKQLSYVLGNSLHAVATVVAAFLTGLALGAYFLGARLARLRQGAKNYALLEFGIAILGLASMPILRGLDPVVASLYAGFGGESGAMIAVRFALLFAMMLPPTVLMGATLPVLVAHFEYAGVGPALARLYALNTVGAVAGSALGGFVLLPSVGLTATTWIAAAMNAVAGLIAWRGAGKAPAPAPAPEPPPAAPPDAKGAKPGKGAAKATARAGDTSRALLEPGPRTALAVLFAVSGLAALTFQIAWVRLFGLLFGSSVYSFSAVLAVYLAGLGVGSACAAPLLKKADRPRAAVRLLALLGGVQMALAVVTLASVRLFPWLPEAFYALGARAKGDWTAFYLGELGFVSLILAIPCIGFGMAFPLAARLLQTRDGGHATGLTYAVNTIGTLTGSLLAGFVLVPTLGVQGTHMAAAALIGVAGAGIWALAFAAGMTPWRAGAGLAAALALSCAFAFTAPAWNPSLMSAGVFRPAVAREVLKNTGAGSDAVQRYTQRERVLFYREGINGSVYVASDSTDTVRWLKVGGKVDASSGGDMLTQVLAGVLPNAIAPEGARTALIGLGSGITLSAVLAAGAGPVQLMEIEPSIVEASRFFNEPGQDPLADPRVKLLIGDARTHLFGSKEKWDVVISEPSNPWISGVNNLFTVDFYRRLRARIDTAGVFCQWVQLYELAPETLGSMLRSFLEVFPHGWAFFVSNNHDLLLVATPPGRTLPLERLRSPAVAHQLARARQLAPESVAAWYACPFDSLVPLTRGVPFNRDDLPIVEYRAPRDLYLEGSRPDGGSGYSLIPITGWKSTRGLFADWPMETWFTARARQFAASGHTAAAAGVAREAASIVSPELGRAVAAVAAKERVALETATLRNEARTAASRGQWPAARKALERAAAIDPGSGQTWAMLADVLRFSQEYDASVDAARKAVAHGDSTDRSYARTVEGSVEMARGRPGAAATAFADAARWSPRDENPWLMTVQAQVAAGDTAGAIATARRGVAVAKDATNLRTALTALGVK